MSAAAPRRPLPARGRLDRALHRLAAHATHAALSLAGLLGGTSALAAEPAPPKPFEFVALGDMPYGAPETAYPVYQHLIGLVNAQAPAFSVHVGDFKSGSSLCSDDEFARQRDFFNQFDSALVYTPGDNEWTDCHRPAAGGYAPQERLEALREMFFGAPRSLGRRPLAVERQADVQPAHARYRENLRFTREGVLFLTLNVPGSNNGFEPRDLAAVQEHFARTDANLAWLQAGFEQARRQDARAVVIAMQADPFLGANVWSEFPSHSGFTRLFEQGLLPMVQDWGRPVLLIHGDSHRFVIDRPFKAVKEPGKGQVLRNLLRLQVFGEQEVHAVRVTVDPANPDPFAFKPLFNPLSPR
ncbi:hypothetical protein QRD43_04685 [Pelomonas sp. APW6]|uniref:Calcineurin-like phosphoesterase domain-containing protein n=1 Tax=Roseateles subflavus TaxID=3053353 RepID=A0ABT7LI14_9BURK|nr:hypothetical protein [Pelomonas sp. APW6]MDL5031196.1 hypothetical protein [Pelomonas sp. APW6]